MCTGYKKNRLKNQRFLKLENFKFCKPIFNLHINIYTNRTFFWTL